MNEQKISFIERKRLHPHPENPRKDLGDLEELRESIRENGIMQNLTVVAGRMLSKAEWKEFRTGCTSRP